MSSEWIWETFDGLFKAVHRQGRRVEELEERVAELERRLNERAAPPPINDTPAGEEAAHDGRPT